MVQFPMVENGMVFEKGKKYVKLCYGSLWTENKMKLTKKHRLESSE